MKNMILFVVLIAAGALLISVSNGYTYGSYTNCQTQIECNNCHRPGGPGESKGIFTFCDMCPNDQACAPSTPTPTCANDNDGDGYLGEPGNTSCADCDDSDTSVNPDATENCFDDIDNDCNGAVDCDDIYCAGEPACWLANCVDYNNPKDRVGCKNNPNCNWSGKNGCSEIDPDQLACQADGGRWNKKKKTCTIR